MHDYIYKGLGEVVDEQRKALMEHLSAQITHWGSLSCNETNHISVIMFNLIFLSVP